MKNTFIIFALLFLGNQLCAQSTEAMPTVEATVGSFTDIYGLDQEQQVKMFEIQERKYRNFDDIEKLKAANPKKYQAKVSAMKAADQGHMLKLLNETQQRTFQARMVELRKEKAERRKQMKSSGAHPHDIEKEMTKMDVNALLNG